MYLYMHTYVCIRTYMHTCNITLLCSPGLAFGEPLDVLVHGVDQQVLLSLDLLDLLDVVLSCRSFAAGAIEGGGVDGHGQRREIHTSIELDTDMKCKCAKM